MHRFSSRGCLSTAGMWLWRHLVLKHDNQTYGTYSFFLEFQAKQAILEMDAMRKSQSHRTVDVV